VLVLILLLQAMNPEAAFRLHVETACNRLHIVQAPVELSSQRRWASWVPQGVGAGWIIYVRPDFLHEADYLAIRSVAYHETCHLYLGNDRRRYLEGEEDLVHLMVYGCVEWLHGPDFHRAMTTMPCQKWYPSEATRYNRLIGKEHCIAKK